MYVYISICVSILECIYVCIYVQDIPTHTYIYIETYVHTHRLKSYTYIYISIYIYIIASPASTSCQSSSIQPCHTPGHADVAPIAAAADEACTDALSQSH